MATQYLMACAIGPVQEFIASARRSRDLWFGSWLLSELSKAAARAIVAQSGDKLDSLIFPRITDAQNLQPDSAFNVVNKLLAVIETDDPAAFGRRVKINVKWRLREIRNEAWRRLSEDKYLQRAVAIRQTYDLLEFFWAAVPLDDPQNYKTARDRAEALLAARKTTRGFDAVSWGQPGVPKSSLDGQRESVIHDNAYEAVRLKRMTKAELRRRFDVRPGERLCGVGLLKRLGNRGNNDRFSSTSHIAALPLLQTLRDQKALADYIRELTGLLGVIEARDLREIVGKVPAAAHHPVFGHYDGRLLFEDRLREFFEDDTEQERAKQSLRKFLDQAFGKNVRPLQYYALLLADGDRMGKAIDAITNVDRHRELSRQLSDFAASVRAIVENRPDEPDPNDRGHQGSLVYAGGDDVLAFVPLHRVLDCARQLAAKFKKKLEHFNDAGGQAPTLSVGIAITHHLEPLADALELARAAEKAAKSVPGKEALCIKVSKRGGSVTTLADKWGKLDHRLAYFTLLHRAEAVPDGAAYELHDLVRRLKQTPEEIKKEVLRILEREQAASKQGRFDDKVFAHRLEEIIQTKQEMLKEMMRLEAIRILKRKRGARGAERLDDKIFKRLKKLIENTEIAKLADELIVARLLAEAAAQSGETVEQAKELLNQEVEHEDMDH